MRSSNLSDGLNFHLRMRVQITTIPPMEAAKAITTVNVVLVVEVAPLLGGLVAVELESEEVTVLTSGFWPFWLGLGVLVGDDEGASFSWVGVEGGGVWVVEVVVGEEVGEDVLELEEEEEEEELELRRTGDVSGMLRPVGVDEVEDLVGLDG